MTVPADVLSSGNPDRTAWRPPRPLILLLAAALGFGLVGYVVQRAPAERRAAGSKPAPHHFQPVVIEGRVIASSRSNVVRYDPGEPTSPRRAYLRYDGPNVSVIDVTAGVVDVLVTPSSTVLLFNDRATVVRRPEQMRFVLGPADAVFATHDRTAVLLVDDRGSVGGEMVERVQLNGDPAGPRFRLPPGSRALAETSDGRLVVGRDDGSLVLWNPRTTATHRLAERGVLDSVVGRWAVTHDVCGGDPCRYRLRSLDGRRSIEVIPPRRTALLGPPVLSPDGVHFAVVVDIFAGFDYPGVALGVASIASGGADLRIPVGVQISASQRPRGAQPTWSADGTTVYAPRPQTGEDAAYRIGADWAQITPYRATDVSRIWVAS